MFIKIEDCHTINGKLLSFSCSQHFVTQDLFIRCQFRYMKSISQMNCRFRWLPLELTL